MAKDEDDGAHISWLRGGSAADRAEEHRPTVTFGAKLRYRFDGTISKGPAAVILWLFIVASALILLFAVVLTLANLTFGNDEATFAEVWWQSLLRFLDAGTMGGDEGWRLRVLALGVTIGGIFLAGSLIGLISAGIDSRIEEIRKGRSFVVERNHLVVLGWSQRIGIIVAEALEAFENEPGRAIVVLSHHDKTWMEDEIRGRVGDAGRTPVVCRTGDPSSLADLGMVNIDEANAILVLSDDEMGGDAQVIKSVLAIRARGDHLLGVPVVVEVADGEAGEALADACGGIIIPVHANDVVAQVTAQACRQPGLSYVLQDLLSFVGDEIYFQAAPELVGRTYLEAMLAYETSSIIGIVDAAGTAELNPPGDRVFAAGEQVIAISEDDDTVIFTGLRPVPTASLPPVATDVAAEHLLVVGWSALGAPVLSILDGFVPPGSTVEVLIDPEQMASDPPEIPVLARLACQVVPTRRRARELSELAQQSSYTSVMILGSRVGVTASEADARTLFTLLLLARGFNERPVEQRPRIVAELLESQDVELAQVTGADDFIASDALASLMMTQLALDPTRRAVFEDLFDADGMAMNVKTAAKYVEADLEVSWGELVAAAAARGESALGYRLTRPGERHATIAINPPKSQRVTFDHDDHIVVVGLTE